MQILLKCPKCDAGLPVRAAEAPAVARCGRCGAEMSLDISPSLKADERVDRCPLCMGADLYTRKDFNPRIGLAIVVSGALVSAVFYWFRHDLVAYGILAAAVLVDLVAYGWLKDVTVCYRCHSEFRGAYRRTAPAFDLHTADVLEQEYERRIGRR